MGEPAPRRVSITAGALLGILCIALAAIAGRYHFVYGGPGGIQKIAKQGWSLSETVINLNEVAGTPPLLLRARYPLFAQAMERVARDGE